MPIALFHGFTGDRTSWAEVCDYWQPDQPGGALATEEAMPLDLPGHGRIGPAVRQGWRANLEAVHALLTTCIPGVREGEGELIVVGYSLGARVALGLVAAELADRAVLVSVNPGIDEDERAARRASDAAWAALLRERGIAEFAARWTAQPLFASQARGPDEAARQRRQAVRLAQSAEALAQSLEQMGLAEMPDYRSALPRIAEQLVLVVGERDDKFRALAEQMVAVAPRLPLHVIAGSGHDIPLEQPRVLAELLTQVLPTSRPG